jgi:hypothetical protein
MERRKTDSWKVDFLVILSIFNRNFHASIETLIETWICLLGGKQIEEKICDEVSSSFGCKIQIPLSICVNLLGSFSR